MLINIIQLFNAIDWNICPAVLGMTKGSIAAVLGMTKGQMFQSIAPETIKYRAVENRQTKID